MRIAFSVLSLVIVCAVAFDLLKDNVGLYTRSELSVGMLVAALVLAILASAWRPK